MKYLYPIVMTAIIVAPLLYVYLRRKSGKSVKSPLIAQIACFFVVGVAGLGLMLTGSAEGTQAAAATAESGLKYIAAALSVGLSGIGGGIAVSSAAAAALGAISENETVFGKSLIMVALAEGISLWGLIIAFMILG